jgi:glutathione S-transferase
VGTGDWFRNTNWNAEIAAEFERRLKRSRTQKGEYLRIQALSLADTHPSVALELSDRFLALPKPNGLASVLNIRARALVAVKRVAEATSTYERVLQVEKEVGARLTDAYLDYAQLVLSMDLTHLFPRVRAILHECADRPGFRFNTSDTTAFWCCLLLHRN